MADISFFKRRVQQLSWPQKPLKLFPPPLYPVKDPIAAFLTDGLGRKLV